MANRTAWCVLPMLFAAHAGAQTVLYGVRGNGDLVRIDPATGAGVLVGGSDIGCNAAASANYPGGVETIMTGGAPGALADQITSLNRWTGAEWYFISTTGRPPNYEIRGMAMRWPGPVLYVILGAAPTTTIDTLATIDLTSGAYTVIGPTGQTNLRALAVNPSGILYALGTNGGGSLYTLNTSTGTATLVGGGGFGDDDQSLEFLPDGSLRACGSNLLSVNPSTGETTLIGPTGFADIRGLAAVTRSGCYANCSPGCDPPPCLNVLDFGCFLNRFALGAPYANCDQSTTPPVLNVLDFMCFLNAFASASGC